MDKKIKKLIYAHFNDKMDKKTNKFANLASWDLYYGPISGCDDCGADRLIDCDCPDKFPGFTKACEHVGEWASEHVGDLYLDTDTGVLTDQEPKGWEDEEGEWNEPGDTWIHYDRKEVLKCLFGTELVQYL